LNDCRTTAASAIFQSKAVRFCAITKSIKYFIEAGKHKAHGLIDDHQAGGPVLAVVDAPPPILAHRPTDDKRIFLLASAISSQLRA
jgi:hypothetical protein